MSNLLFISPTYNGRSTSIDASRSVNLYLEKNPETAKGDNSLIGTPGLALFTNAGANAVRGMHVFNGYMWAVIGSGLYRIDANGGISSSLGTLGTSTGRVGMANNGLSPTGGNQIIIVDGSANSYLYNVSTGFSTVAVSLDTVCFLGGYFIGNLGGGGSGQWQVSALYDGSTWNALDKSTADAFPDRLMRVINNHGELWLQGEYTTEIWYQSGVGRPPFARMAGGVLEYGTAARWSAAKGDNTIFWLGSMTNNDGAGEIVGIVAASGYGAQIISPPSINYQITNMADVSDAFGFCYTDEGHTFYMITFPTGNATYVYDSSTKQWHERSAYQGSTFAVGRHQSNCYVYFNNKHYVGDYRNGSIYQMTASRYDDNGQPIVSWRTASYIHDRESRNLIFHHKLIVDAETGVGTANANDTFIATQANNVGGRDWVDVAYSGSQFCAVASNTTSWGISSDGITWANSNTTQSLVSPSIAWNGSVFCVVGQNIGTSYTSSNGANWANHAMSSNAAWSCIASNGSVFCALGTVGSNNCATSPDGANWTAHTAPANTWVAIASNGVGFCAIDNANAAATSPDGANWTGYTKPNSIWGAKSLAWNGSVFCAISSNDTIVATSPDGANWTQTATLGTVANGDNFTVGGVSWNGTIFLAVPSGGAVANKAFCVISKDGANWTTKALTANATWRGVSWGGVAFVVIAGSGSSVVERIIYIPVPANTDPVNPTAYLSWSDDNQQSWSQEYSTPLGTTGQIVRLVWRRLGKSRARTYRLRITDPVKRIINGASLEWSKGSS